MKRIFLLSLIFSTLSLISAKAQNNVGIGTTTPVASALLDLTATDKGLLIPRVTLVAATNGTTPVAGPATGLLVFNTGGAMTAGFYYWDGSQWVQVGAASAPTCVTLDGAYDCGGNGVGRSITADAGSVAVNVTSGVPATTTPNAIKISIANGTSTNPTAGLNAEHSGIYGGGVFGLNSASTNLYAAVSGQHLGTNTNSSYFPSGVSGYFDGTGIGVGVWGENTSNTASGLGAGIYGNGIGSTAVGVWGVGNSMPGLLVETYGSTYPAAEIYGASNINPGLNVSGSSVFFVSNAAQKSIHMNNIANEPTLAPSFGGWGFLGTNTIYWYALYYQTATAVSRRELKRDIVSFDSDLYSFAMEDIMKMKPSLYKFNNENNEIVDGEEQKTRYNYHVGLILDETPDYLQDNAFGGIDVYSLSTLTLAGVQYLANEVSSIKKNMEVNEFGTISVSSGETRINYSSEFSNNSFVADPIVMITVLSPDADYYIKSQDNKGFTIVSKDQSLNFNWLALGRIAEMEENYEISPEIMNQLKIDEAKKQEMRTLMNSPQIETHSTIYDFDQSFKSIDRNNIRINQNINK
ncbi:MAG: hypothetical protein A2W93_05540 [Bacteroidetes bacterium GWF2_43_63]|nr:MAG: hypothetical protein A2W94_07525 [Bacteroidetes bacterium GWE2_42_42]OFY55480.1 MAG: hypothetical protein A2W93_05540 [Bacteroidetes bacterium GWF2_43_63]HBG69955.1 hypothetical protein [Bacteroidales bacterium]HCB62619.1 hypothetical protein [Bacteroidales bacterium]HCY23739.1 hypothetical protein [Bacteroidales bacterium]